MWCAAWLLIWVQTFPPPMLLAVAAETAPPALQSAPPVTVNRTVPAVAPPSSVLSFSASPTANEITRAQVFAEPLIASGEVTAAENVALATALTSYAGRTERMDVSALTGFLTTHPQSPWRASLWLSLGHLYYHGGWFSKALDAWEEAWQQSKQETSPSMRAVADQAAGQLTRMNARLGRAERLEPLFAELQGRTITGSATELLTGAREGLWLMRHKPEDAFRCGPMALGRILAAQHPPAALFENIHTSRSTPSGMSMSAVKELADTLGLSLQMAVKEPAAPMLLPAVVHWRVGHYAAIIKEQGGRYLIEDPTFHDDLWISRAALDAEASGYYLVPAGPLPTGWLPVSVQDGGNVWGKGNTAGNDKDRDTPCDDKAKQGGCGAGMAQYNMHTMLVSLNITDTPLFYDTPHGGGIAFTVTYNQREANQPGMFSTSNFGQKWSCN